ncbi:hypothetical protein G3580_15685 [Nitrogeniibacter mangrovi]|uniref:Uncharacterized protein n=1 Tax=Nitrogeniibacter mangrovi TaxID=2016596 RepID=A0A6C1B7Z3_9RHOO|nr:hypothetical protein [Nitrogeniibacter mangrovi]QID18935.1 hypothetical protein G3580_15685 [Nitrogeniibacter mangrovi]
MKSPKLLPWYARKAGVSIERAEVLWRKAVRKATADTGWVGNAEYWGAAMDNFLALLEAENSSLCTPNLADVLRMQHRAMRLPLTLFEDLSAATAANWQRYFSCWHRAA